MRLFSRGEWRHAVFLILLLVIAASASVRFVRHVESVVAELEFRRARERMADLLVSEMRRIEALAGTLAGRAGGGGAQDGPALLVSLAEQAAEAGRSSTIMAVLGPDGNAEAITVRGAPVPHSGAGALLRWADAAPGAVALLEKRVFNVDTALGPALMAVARLPDSEDAAAPRLLAVAELLQGGVSQRLRESYPAFNGLVPSAEQGSRNTCLVPVVDVQGRPLGSYAVSVDMQWPDEMVQGITLIVFALTMGFLFLAGALGMWGIRSSAEVEGRRRVGEFVDSMDYLRDGLLVVDKRRRVTGANPAARVLAGRDPASGEHVQNLFPLLSPEDADSLLQSSQPHELTRTHTGLRGQRMWRFRSQPSSDMNLILISDVTDEKMRERRQLQLANLQLIGRIARGVAHDFNNILCAVSGHAALLNMPEAGGTGFEKESLDAIVNESRRGANLAAHLLELSRTGKGEQPAAQLDEHLQKAAELLRIGLTSSWCVDVQSDKDCPVLPLSGMQIEKAVLNLGLLLADEMPRPGTLKIMARHPRKEHLLDVGSDFAVVIVIEGQDSTLGAPGRDTSSGMLTTIEEAGAIQSVVRSIMEDVGGRLDIMLIGGRHLYRICVPAFEIDDQLAAGGELASVRMRYMKGWQVLLALSNGRKAEALKGRLEECGAKVEVTRDLVSTLSSVDAGTGFSAMVLDRQLLGAEGDGLLRAILKLQPQAGMVVLSETLEGIPAHLAKDIVFELESSEPEMLLDALLRAKGNAARRGAIT